MKALIFIVGIATIAGSCTRMPDELEKLRPIETQAVRFDASNPSTVTLYSNGYVYPEDQVNGYGSISSTGLSAWTDTAGFTRVFFYPQQAGKIYFSIVAKAPGDFNMLRVRLDSSDALAWFIPVSQSSTYTTIQVGDFNIDSARYHCLEITAVTKNGTYLPDVKAIVFSGPAAVNLKYNTSQYRGAPATHLYYNNDDNNVSWFYTEISVPEGADPLYSYYVTNGFNGGYLGIQVNSPTQRKVLFSIWSNYSTDDPTQIPPDYTVKLVKKGTEVITKDFGGEGSGGQSSLMFNWTTETTYKLLVHAEAAGDHTIYTAYIFTPETNKWNLVAGWDKPKTGGQLLGGLYSFIENYGSNGNDLFKARYGNQWVCSSTGVWKELKTANFSTSADPVGHPRYDYGGGASGQWMYMYSGSFKEMNNLRRGGLVQRNSTGTPPNIDFNSLPNN
ncbi:protein of unknown function [Chitinophaga sp. CF118]|uniref:DUF3472 domain-containing protein n=1 Tax=Chitinophaga sp. CF118 TaxID=1884367 RepID=UPI0008ED102E|nr:DUF3472 domain-containing protein [Chitinophaga sp. CF118]SFD16474.1 protein of unknown function [Chitinophaga sp. CF118]